MSISSVHESPFLQSAYKWAKDADCFSSKVLKRSATIIVVATIIFAGIALQGKVISFLTDGCFTTLNYAILSSKRIYPLIKWGYIINASIIAMSLITKVGASLAKYLLSDYAE